MPRGFAAAFRHGPSRRCCRQTPLAPVAADLDDVAAPLKLLDRGLGQAPLDDHTPGLRRARPEGAREMLDVPRRRVDRFLQIETGMNVAQEKLAAPLVLLVAAGRAPASGRAPRRASAIPTDSVERGRLPGASEAGRPSSSQNICPRVPSGNPSSGITGEDCSQPPDGVAVNMLPSLSMTSKWQVSPRTAPRRRRRRLIGAVSREHALHVGPGRKPDCGLAGSRRAARPPRPTTTRPVRPAIEPGRCSSEARSLSMSLRRSAL